MKDDVVSLWDALGIHWEILLVEYWFRKACLWGIEGTKAFCSSFWGDVHR